MSPLFSKTLLGSVGLRSRLAMAPMTRSRATDNIPNALMVQYYAQRSSVGLVITEGTAPSANGVGYPRIPGIYSDAQIEGWRRITDALHAGGAAAFLQLMHCGRIAHPANLPPGARVLAPSAVAAAGAMYTDALGMQALPTPQPMSAGDIAAAVAEFATAAANAANAGFDGVELHAANGYLLEQFLRPNTNRRTDRYGGPIENRARFVLEVVDAVSGAIGGHRVGIRLSPFGSFNDMPDYPQMAHDYTYLGQRLAERGLAYLHIADHSAMGGPPVPDSIKATLRTVFTGSLILCGGYDRARADADLAANRCDLIAVGRPLIANPDLPMRWRIGRPLNAPDPETFYTPGAKGYTDYPIEF